MMGDGRPPASQEPWKASHRLTAPSYRISWEKKRAFSPQLESTPAPTTSHSFASHPLSSHLDS